MKDGSSPLPNPGLSRWMMIQMIGVFTKFEPQMIQEQTRAGLENAKRRGVKLGRRRALTREQVVLACQLSEQGKRQREIGRLLGVSQSTVGRALRLHQTRR